MRLFAASSILAFVLATTAAAQEIYRDSDAYAYQGCITETTDIANSSRPRALPADSLVDEGGMTVPMCLDFCAGGGSEGRREYRFAGLQFSRECWCAQLVSDLSRKVDDAQCNFTCDGDDSTYCGGAMRISLYEIEEDDNAASMITSAGAWAVLGAAGAVAAYVMA